MIDSKYYTANRARLMARIDINLVVVTAHAEMQRVKDMAFKFEQETNFLWLTGIKAPQWKLVIDGSVSYLVKPDMDEVHAVFDGALSAEDAQRISGVDRVISPHEYETLIQALAKKHHDVATLGEDPSAEWYTFSLNPAQKDLRDELTNAFTRVTDCRRDLSALRAIKQPVEIAATKAAMSVTLNGFKNVQKMLTAMKYEYEIEALLNGDFRRTGAGGHAYEPIVAAGKNACTLHYCDNNDQLPKSGLVLIDAGARVDGFAADVTRTYAVGAPTPRQREIHKAVEAAHYKIIDLIKPGVSLQAYQTSVDEIMKDALHSVGLLPDRDDQKVYHTYFPHAVSHGLGTDVHESLGGYKEFTPGMILTVEPGIYIPEEGIGVRIEDDILVTKTGNENLSAQLPTSL